VTTSSEPVRFHDPGDRLEAFLDEVLVRCPRCRERARVTPVPGPPADADAPPAPVRKVVGPLPPRTGPFADRRLVCGACALVRTWPPPDATRTYVTGTDVDPWFREPLWLRAEVVGEVLWAYNARHLDALDEYIGATLRTKDHTPGMIHTMVNRLPTWMKEARNRAPLRAAIAKLRASL
jgi:hypothetical protein